MEKDVVEDVGGSEEATLGWVSLVLSMRASSSGSAMRTKVMPINGHFTK
jgi:hypothetical protein